jgi:predicted enzyme related to lactoylglutathione lyase
MDKVINWFEIAVSDFDRAKKFYETIFGVKMEMPEMKMPGMESVKMAFFPIDPMSGTTGGGIVKSEKMEPSSKGVLVYLNGGDDLSAVLNKVEGAGGKVLQPKMSIGEHGFMAIFTDTEGNSIGLHSMK